MKFFPTAISLIALALGVEYVLAIRRVSAQVTGLIQEVRALEKAEAEDSTDKSEQGDRS